MFNVTIRAYVIMVNSVGDEYNFPVEFSLDNLDEVAKVIRKSMSDNRIDDSYVLRSIEF